MFGRDQERAQVEQLLDQALSGPVGLALEGEPGIGKTTLWREAVGSARERGYQVVSTSPGVPDAALTFAGLTDLFEAAAGELAAGLPDPQRLALAAALSLEDTPAAIDPLGLSRAVLTMLRQLAAQGPVVVAIDDEQWLDPASARVLAFGLCRVREERVCVLLARRAHSTGTLWPELARGFAGEGLQTVTVSPLDLSTIEGLLRARLGRAIPRPLLRRVHTVSGGNPLYALEIAREIEAAELGSGDLPIPRTLSEAMRRRLEQVHAGAHVALAAVAALPEPSLALLSAVVEGFSLPDLDSAITADVIEIVNDRVRFTHPLLASTHYAAVPAAQRRELHHVLGLVLEDDEERARHLALAAEGPSREISLALDHAAETAARRGAPESAARLLEQAIALTPIDAVEVRHSRTLAAADQHRLSANSVRARTLLESLIAELPPGPTRARALLVLFDVRWDDEAAGEVFLRQALAEAGEHDRLRAEIESVLSGFLSNRGEFDAMLVHARSAIECAERTGDPGLVARGLAALGVALFFTGHGIAHDVMARAVALEDPTLSTTYNSPSGELAQTLFWGDDYARARPALERAVERARDRGEQYDMGALMFELAILEWHAGNRAPAERHLAAAEEAVREQGDQALDLWLAWGASLFSAGRGELDVARVQACEAIELAQRISDPLIGALPTIVLASVELWTGRPEAAHDLLQAVRESFAAKGFGFMGSLTVGLWAYDIEALIACGRLEEAARVVDDLASRARNAGNHHAIAIAERCRGLLLASRGELDAAMAAIDAALAEHALCPLEPELARTLLELGAVQRRAKRKNAAKQSLQQALSMFEPMGAAMWAARARDELTRIGLRRPSAGPGLTAAQTRVAELVAQGMSNREIANTLYMSVRSVEAHLTKVYREFGVRSRAQLVSELASRRQPSESGERVGPSDVLAVRE